MSNQPPYGQPPGGYPPPGGYQGGGYQGGGYPPPGGPTGKTKVFGLDNNLAALLCYLLNCCCLGIVLSIIFLAAEPKENRFVRFHAMQSLLLVGVSIVISIVFTVLGVGMSFNPSDVLGAAGGSVLGLIHQLISLAILVLNIIAAIKAYQGQMWKIPVLGDIAEKNS